MVSNRAINSLSTIEIQDEVSTNNRASKVFMVFPFKKNELYDHIKSELTQFNLKVYRADEILPAGNISNNIRKCIDDSDIVIADLSEMNSSVMYELGYAHGNGKNVIAFTSDKETIPFDASNYLGILYEESIEGFRALAENLKETIAKLEQKSHSKEQMKNIAEVVLQATPYVGNIVKLLRMM